MSSSDGQTNPDEYIQHLLNQEGTFLHNNDAIGIGFVSLVCTIFFNRDIPTVTLVKVAGCAFIIYEQQ